MRSWLRDGIPRGPLECARQLMVLLAVLAAPAAWAAEPTGPAADAGLARSTSASAAPDQAPPPSPTDAASPPEPVSTTPISTEGAPASDRPAAPVVAPGPAGPGEAPTAANVAAETPHAPASTGRAVLGWGGLPPLQVHAFASQGFIKSTKNNYLVNSKRGSFEFTEVGINFTQSLTDRFRTGMQLFAQQLGKVGDYRVRIDWAYLDYNVADWLGLQVGRTKMPFGLYNDIADVDAARVPILLPQATYPILNRNILLALTGIHLYGYVRLGVLGALDYRLYGGTLYSDPPAPIPGLVLKDYGIPYLVGGRALWEPPVEGLRVGGSVQWLRIDARYEIPPAMAGVPPISLTQGIPFFLWLASAEYAAHDVMLAAEYGRWRADVELTGLPTLRVVNERFYVMAAYRVRRWLTPGVYFSSFTENRSTFWDDLLERRGRANYQHDWTATLRFDLNTFWTLKLEGHYIRGTNDVASALNGDSPRAMLAPSWLLFLAKTTVYF